MPPFFMIFNSHHSPSGNSYECRKHQREQPDRNGGHDRRAAGPLHRAGPRGAFQCQRDDHPPVQARPERAGHRYLFQETDVSCRIETVGPEPSDHALSRVRGKRGDPQPEAD